ncbi:putative heme exporter protein CcmC [Anaplasma phagocytophilum str. CR1007]|nr:putative heme exporter protein CcmC [Anaplasma phagocytophilum str. CR1007]
MSCCWMYLGKIHLGHLVGLGCTSNICAAVVFPLLGYASLWNVFEDQNRAAKTTSLFALFSAVNVPIVKFSVDIWATLHQTSSILRKGGIAIDSSMLIPLLTMFVALSLLFVILTSLRFYTLLNNRQTSSSLYPFYHETT